MTDIQHSPDSGLHPDIEEAMRLGKGPFIQKNYNGATDLNEGLQAEADAGAEIIPFPQPEAQETNTEESKEK